MSPMTQDNIERHISSMRALSPQSTASLTQTQFEADWEAAIEASAPLQVIQEASPAAVESLSLTGTRDSAVSVPPVAKMQVDDHPSGGPAPNSIHANPQVGGAPPQGSVTKVMNYLNVHPCESDVTAEVGRVVQAQVADARNTTAAIVATEAERLHAESVQTLQAQAQAHVHGVEARAAAAVEANRQ